MTPCFAHFLCRAQIVTARGGKFTVPLVDASHPNSKRGNIIIRSEEVQGVNDQVTILYGVKNLASKGWFGLSKPSRLLFCFE